jgi:hypothetical protein
MPEEDDVKRSNVIEMPKRKPKANPTREEVELWSLEGLMMRAISSHRMRRRSDLRKICKTLG